MKKRALRRGVAVALAAGCLSVLPATAAGAQEYVCVPGQGGTTVTILGQDYWVPGHPLPCQRVPEPNQPEIYFDENDGALVVSFDREGNRVCVFGTNGYCNVWLEGWALG